ncbi:MAG: VacJ family lipoprotein [Deltaproteobacteria bacterium]|nr:VacJ family lipoprotein [Deltaproteobacteria bacterium]
MQTASDDGSDADFQDDFGDEVETEVPDPLEPVNRVIFRFNDKVYFYLFKPVAKAYRIVPEQARVSVADFFSNLFTPVRFVNSLLQLKFQDAGNELTRFLVNTTVGCAGFFDPAGNDAGLVKKEEDFGQTLGRYGVGGGFYIVLPFLGPSNLRDGIGLLADGALNPIYYLGIGDGAKIGVRAYYSVNALSLDQDTYESIKRESLDPYLFIRNAYGQRRDGFIKK